MRKRVSLVDDGGCVSNRTLHVYCVNVKGPNSKFLQNRGGGYAFCLVTGGDFKIARSTVHISVYIKR
jgi:hypothetical protein